MSKHTPGPWAKTECSNAGLLLVRPGCKQMRLQIYPEADARLIAAAPDLLAALKAADEELSHLSDDDGSVGILRRETIGPAIAKAEGRS